MTKERLGHAALDVDFSHLGHRDWSVGFCCARWSNRWNSQAALPSFLGSGGDRRYGRTGEAGRAIPPDEEGKDELICKFFNCGFSNYRHYVIFSNFDEDSLVSEFFNCFFSI